MIAVITVIALMSVGARCSVPSPTIIVVASAVVVVSLPRILTAVMFCICIAVIGTSLAIVAGTRYTRWHVMRIPQ